MDIGQFEDLLNEVKEAYAKSSLKDSGYNYSLVGTQIKINQPLIIGLNWGGGKTEAQTRKSYEEYIEKDVKFQNVKDIGSLSRIKTYLKDNSTIDYEKSHIGWTNYCFFRTPNESELMKNPEDLKLTNDIFLKLLNIIKPSMILSFSSKLRDYVNNNDEINFNNIKEYIAKNEKGENKYYGLIGELNDIPFYSLPHPEARVGNVARDSAWESCFQK